MKNNWMGLWLFVLLLLGCRQNLQKEQQSTTSPEMETATPNAPSISNSKTKSGGEVLSKAEFQAFFPKQIGPYERMDISVLKTNAIATGTYIKGKDYNTSLVLTLQDGNRKNSGIITNFLISYDQNLKGPQGTEYIKKERDGYKTIAFLQPEIKRNLIECIYKNRFRISLEGVDDVATLWQYLDKENFSKLEDE